MADNTTLNAGTGGDVVRTKDRTGVKLPLVGIDLTPGGGSETLMNGSMPVTSAAAAQVDGHSANIGALADADTASTLTGLLKKLKALFNGGLPAALTSEGTLKVTQLPSASGGLSTMNASSSDGATALTSTAQAIKASAGALRAYYIYNPNTVAAFVQFYNIAAGSVTVGTSNPLFMLTIPPGSSANLAIPDGVDFGTAMSWAATSTAGGNGAPTTALDAICWYK